MNVLITGVQNAVEESIVRIAVERLEGKAPFRLLSFSDFSGEGTAAGELEVIEKTQKKIADSMRVRLMDGGEKHVIVNGYCTVGTPLGIFPVITNDTLEALKPRLLIHIGVDPEALEGRLDDPKAFRDHQETEKAYSIMLCAASGCGIKTIRCGPDGARKASDELYALLKDILVKK